MPKKEKTKEERLAETVSLLTQLKNNGVRSNSLGYLTLKQRLTAWVESGVPEDFTVPFREYGREAVVSLPRYNNRAAGINFNVVKEDPEETKIDDLEISELD
jgi:hypothetical protein